MSRLWRDQLRIALSPGRVELVRLGKGLRRKVLAMQSEACAPAPGWQAALNTLNRLLAGQGGADVVIVLSSAFARHVIVPWSDELSGKQELATLAQHRFSQVYGPQTSDWEVRVDAGRFGVPMLASGVERALPAALRQSCSARGLRLASVQPALMAAFNRWHRLPRERGGWFGLAEGGLLTLALLHGGGWHAVQSRHYEGALAEALADRLEQAQRLADLADVPRTAWIFAPQEASLALPVGHKWTLHALELPPVAGGLPQGEAACGLALAGEA